MKASSRIIGLVLVIHPFPVLVVVLTSGVMLALVEGGMPNISLLVRAILAVLLSQVAVGSLNDFIDRHDDSRMQPDKPIPTGLISAGSALKLCIVSLTVLVPVSLSLGWRASVLVLVGTSAGLLYDFRLKRTPWSVMGYIVGFLSLFTWVCVIANRFPPWFAFGYVLGPPLIVAAHLAQSLPDIETDRRLGLRGLAVVLGYTNSSRVLLALYFINAVAAALSALIRHSGPAALLASLSLLLLVRSFAISRGQMDDRRVRVRLFHVVAPGLALAALSSMLSIASSE